MMIMLKKFGENTQTLDDSDDTGKEKTLDSKGVFDRVFDLGIAGLLGIFIGVTICILFVPQEINLETFYINETGAFVSGCWFEVYDTTMRGMAIRIYNITDPKRPWVKVGDCDRLKNVCESKFSNVDCNWVESEKACECHLREVLKA